MTRDLEHVRWFERLIEPRGYERLLAAVTVVLLVAAVGWLVYATGGTTFVWAHSIYIPILLAALVFQVRGAVMTAVAAGIMLGPWMPLDVASGTAQDTINWVYRLGVLSVIATVAGTMFATMQHQVHRLRRLAYEDLDTDLPNRLSLEANARDIMQRGASKNRTYLLSVRITNFTEVMTVLGPSVARDILRILAERLGTSIGAEGTVYRMSMDSFAVLLPDCSRRRCHETADRILKTIESPEQQAMIPIHLEARIGMASFPVHEATDAEMLIRKSIQALQSAESRGRRWSSYDPKRDELQREVVNLLGELQPAMDRDELELHYQPKIALADGRVTGFEALVRWRHPMRGLVPPGMFVPAAEQSTLIHPLTDWVCETALTQLRRWREAGLDTAIAVNISGRNLSDDGFLPRVRDLCSEFRPGHGDLEFELTENSLFADRQSVSRQLDELKQLGISLSIDDFGTGYSSLSYLHRLDVDALKIDRSFVVGLGDDSGVASQIIETSQVLADKLGMITVAEGVESADILAKLRKLGCSSFQGYLCSPPMPADDATDWLRRHQASGWQAVH